MKKFTEEEIYIIKQNYSTLSKESTKAEMSILLPNRSYSVIVAKAKELGIKKSFWWSEDDIIRLKELYPTTDKDEIVTYFNGRTYKEIQTMANRIKLKRDLYYWSQDEVEILEKHYSYSSQEELEELLPRHTFSQIQSKANKLKIMRIYKKPNKIKIKAIKIIEVTRVCKLCGKEKNLKSDFKRTKVCKDCTKKMNTIKEHNDKYGIILDFNKIYATFTPIEWWKFTYYGTPNGNKMKQVPYEILFDKTMIDSILKYVIINEMCFDDRNKILNIVLKDFKKYRLNGMLYKFNKSIYELITYLFPNYNIKQWELSATTDNCWDIKGNADDYLKWFIKEKLGVDNIMEFKSEIPKIFTVSELRKINEHVLNSIIHIKKYYTSYYEWFSILFPELNLCPDDFKEHISRDNKRLNSLEELKVYEVMKYDLGINVTSTYGKNKLYTYHNELENENYVPDFIIKKLKDKVLIVEYFGLYKENNTHKIFVNYANKTKRKVAYFENNKDVYFIGLYPDDLKDDFAGVKNKITSFLISTN